MSMQGWQALHSLSRDSSVKERRLAPGTTKRVMSYAGPYKVQIAWFLGVVVVESVLVVASPLLLKSLVDDGIYPKDSAVVIRLSLLVALIAIVGAGLTLVERWFSARIGEGLIYDLRTQVFSHVLRQPVAFFTRAQTGALVTPAGQRRHRRPAGVHVGAVQRRQQRHHPGARSSSRWPRSPGR